LAGIGVSFAPSLEARKIVSFRDNWRGFFGDIWRYAAPIMRVLRAASTASSVITERPLIFRMRFDLHEQAVKQPEVAACDAGNRGDGLRIGEVGFVERETELAPMPGQNE